jgi:hypothetical protein
MISKSRSSIHCVDVDVRLGSYSMRIRSDGGRDEKSRPRIGVKEMLREREKIIEKGFRDVLDGDTSKARLWLVREMWSVSES